MKDRNNMLLGSVLLAGILLLSLYGIQRAIASGNFERMDDDRYDDDRHEKKGYISSKPMEQDQSVYTEECGSCHMAYPAPLLPTESWIRVMNGLGNHFGENAEVDVEAGNMIIKYLSRASRFERGSYREMFRNMDGNVPMRITELPYFRRKHDEIPLRFIRGNDKLGSLSQCNACHRQAEKGLFDEDDVVIPGVGRWDD